MNACEFSFGQVRWLSLLFQYVCLYVANKLERFAAHFAICFNCKQLNVSSPVAHLRSACLTNEDESRQMRRNLYEFILVLVLAFDMK